MTRIVAGSARGRRLQVPNGAVRPTTDRVREAAFSMLDHRLPPWSEVAVGDFFAGSGAMGLEAASRGAAAVLLVEQDRRAAAVAAANRDVVAVPGVSLLRADTWSIGPRDRVAPELPPVGLVVLDPPYAEPDAKVARLLESLHRGGWFVDGAWALVERSARGKSFQWPAGWRSDVDRRYAETRIHLGQLVVSDE